MFAAQAVDLYGHTPVIISKKQKSQIYGAQYLHKAVPGITDRQAARPLRTYRRGTEAAYAKRVYGLGTTPTSWRRVREHALVYDLRSSYETAWRKFEKNIVDMAIDAGDVKDLLATSDLVISTIPLWTLCIGSHKFESIPIVVTKKVHPSILIYGEQADEGNFVIYNGSGDGNWYRASRIFGHESMEALANPKLLRPGWESGFKIVGTNCDCHPTLVRAGRMGTWERGVLTHHAFETTTEVMFDKFGSVMS